MALQMARCLLHQALEASYRFSFNTPGVLADAENNELRRFDRGNADQRYHYARVDDIRGIGFFITLHEEGFLRCAAHQCAIAPETSQESSDIAPDRFPQCPVIGLEDDPASARGD